MFSTSIIEKLAYYIYCLIDPRDGNIFYVGKGVGLGFQTKSVVRGKVGLVLDGLHGCNFKIGIR